MFKYNGDTISFQRSDNCARLYCGGTFRHCWILLCYTCCMMPDLRETSRHCWILLLYLLHDARLERDLPPLLDPLAIPAA